MRRFLRSIAFATLACVGLVPALASTARAGDCRRGALEQLRAAAPDGFAVYQRTKDKDGFFAWVGCGDVQVGLSTAVHETVHAITADADAFPLVGGGDIERPHEVSGFFAPSRMARRFKESDFATTYLRPGKSSSATDFLYLLDELNAYTHDLNAAMDLNRQHPAEEEVDNRDGLAALMAFVAVYAQTAQESEPATWRGLQKPRVARTVSELWGHAESVMAASCGIPRFGAEDKTYIRRFCDAGAQSSLETILGRAPVCPLACLQDMPAAELVSDPAEVAAPRHSARASARSFWRGISHQVSHPSDAVAADAAPTAR